MHLLNRIVQNNRQEFLHMIFMLTLAAAVSSIFSFFHYKLQFGK